MNVKQSVVIRKDLLMSPGLLAAQACHLNDEWLRERILAARLKKFPGKKVFDFGLSSDEFQWMEGPVLSILSVNIPEELDQLMEKAKSLGVEYHVWKDTIPSVIFAGQFLEVVVGVAFGPDDDEKIKQITGTLPLY